MPTINNYINLVNNAVNIDQIGKYLINGLTITSDNTNIVPRDTNGLVKVEEDKPLIIEPTTYRISNKSILKVVNTQFTYYSFPATVNITPVVIPEITFDLPEIDLIYARYKPTDNQSVSANGLGLNQIPLKPRGVELSEVVSGLPQQKQNAYYVSPQVKQSGKDLRIRAKIKHKFQTNDANFPWGVFKAWIAQAGPNKSFEGDGRTKFGAFYGTDYMNIPDSNPNIIPSVLNAAEDLANTVINFIDTQVLDPNGNTSLSYAQAKDAAQSVLNSLPDNVTELSQLSVILRIYIEQLIAQCNSNDDFSYTYISSRRIALTNELSVYNTYINEVEQNETAAGLIKGDIGEQQSLYIDFIVPNSNFEAGDYFQITADSDAEQNPFEESNGVYRYHSIIADETYFVVTDASKNVDVWNEEL
jgi:hypothetical protein